jgi:hypothetical protein
VEQPLLFNVGGGYSGRPLRQMRTAPVPQQADPGEGGVPADAPRVALYSMSPAFSRGIESSGWLRWLLDQWGLPYREVTAAEIKAGGLGDAEVLLVPDGYATQDPRAPEDPYGLGDLGPGGDRRLLRLGLCQRRGRARRRRCRRRRAGRRRAHGRVRLRAELPRVHRRDPARAAQRDLRRRSRRCRERARERAGHSRSSVLRLQAAHDPVRLVVDARGARAARTVLDAHGLRYREAGSPGRVAFAIANPGALSGDEIPWAGSVARQLRSRAVPVVMLRMP